MTGIRRLEAALKQDPKCAQELGIPDSKHIAGGGRGEVPSKPQPKPIMNKLATRSSSR